MTADPRLLGGFDAKGDRWVIDKGELRRRSGRCFRRLAP
ncbi:hypothetical protein ACRAWD_29835 [Caulobacter segnis]